MTSLRLEELLTSLDISFRKNGKRLVGCCPIHGGNNCNALNMFPDGHTIRGNWKCYTRHCETIFKKTLVGFVRGVLSRRKFDWDGEKNTRTVSFQQTVDYLCEFLNQKLTDIKVDLVEAEKRRFAAQMQSLTGRNHQQEPVGWSRTSVRAKLELPASYYLGRGYSPEILQRYDVGFCGDLASPMSNRVVVPVYDEKYEKAIGFTGRTVFDKCPSCKLYHEPGFACPTTTVELFNSSKWKNNHGFQKESHLYNYWFAKKHIKATGVVILVEGPGDVWRLEEAGVHNSVAIFGAELNDEQQILLEMSGAMCVVLLMDSDDTGQDAIRKIAAQLSRSFHVEVIKSRTKDVGELPADEVKSTIKPVIEGLCRKFKT